MFFFTFRLIFILLLFLFYPCHYYQHQHAQTDYLLPAQISALFKKTFMMATAPLTFEQINSNLHTPNK